MERLVDRVEVLTDELTALKVETESRLDRLESIGPSGYAPVNSPSPMGYGQLDRAAPRTPQRYMREMSYNSVGSAQGAGPIKYYYEDVAINTSPNAAAVVVAGILTCARIKYTAQLSTQAAASVHIRIDFKLLTPLISKHVNTQDLDQHLRNEGISLL
jgi:hypothetical protein